MKRIVGLFTLFLAMTLVCCKSEKRTAENPFFSEWNTPYGVPPFDRIAPEHFLPALERDREDARAGRTDLRHALRRRE